MKKILGLITHRHFDKAYSRLHRDVRRAFQERRSLLLIDPEHPLLRVHELQGKWKNHWSINITGDIRAIFSIDGNIAIFKYIGTHAELYGK